MSFKDRKPILGFIGVPINGVYKNVHPFNQPVFLGNGIPAFQLRFLNQQPTNILLPSSPNSPDQCTPLMKWLKKHANDTKKFIQLVEDYRREIDGIIGKSRCREQEVDRITRSLMQLNREIFDLEFQMEKMIVQFKKEDLKELETKNKLLESEEAEFNNISSFLETLINDSITSSEK